MTVFTTKPCVHVYTSNFMRGDPPTAQHHSVCLETQFPPDSPNQPVAGSCFVATGRAPAAAAPPPYDHLTVHRFRWRRRRLHDDADAGAVGVGEAGGRR